MQMLEEECMLAPAVWMDSRYCSVLLLKINSRGAFVIPHCMICIYDDSHALTWNLLDRLA